MKNWYQRFAPLFAIRRAKSQSERKLIFAHWSIRNRQSSLLLNLTSSWVTSTILKERLIPRLRKEIEKDGAVEVFFLTREYSMDVVTTYICRICRTEPMGSNILDTRGILSLISISARSRAMIILCFYGNPATVIHIGLVWHWSDLSSREFGFWCYPLLCAGPRYTHD